MKRMTSREAYDHLVSTGLLKAKQAQVIDQLVLAHGGQATSGEVLDSLQRLLGCNVNVNAWRARFTELQQRGLIIEAGHRPCNVTGRLAVVWRFTCRTKPHEVKRVRCGAKAWKALAMDIWEAAKAPDFYKDRAGYAERIRALGGKP